jgi:predicted amidohydrolase YtcJ
VPGLCRYRSLSDAGVVVVPSSDAPYGPVDPWQIMAAARDRLTPNGSVLGRDEAVPVGGALDGFLRPLDDLSAPPRHLASGAPADLVLLHVPLAEMLAQPAAELVRATWIDGTPAW